MEISSVHLFITINDDFGEMFDACVRRFRKKCLFFFVCKKIVPFFLRFFIFFSFFRWIGCVFLYLDLYWACVAFTCLLFKIVVQNDVHDSHLGRAILLNVYCQERHVLLPNDANPSNEKNPSQNAQTWMACQMVGQFVCGFFFFILWNVTILNHFDFFFFLFLIFNLNNLIWLLCQSKSTIENESFGENILWSNRWEPRSRWLRCLSLSMYINGELSWKWSNWNRNQKH